ncbi:MAG: indolepyruvate oxidoreductase subunit beta [Rhodospirillaceae bacterium]|nr:indolepyruvate oxidoreductase subunit beta [Rhodospirillaceae bacterium]
MTITNILVAGTGGQGVMTATEILSLAALAMGFDVKKTEVAGMAQRGGVVTSHLRFGEKVLSPVIPAGEADVLLAFEAAEALRCCHEVRANGVILVNTLRLAPPVVSSGLFTYPDDPVAALRATGRQVYAFDAGEIARDLGEIKLINTVMLGAISDHLPFPQDELKERIVARFRDRKPALAEANARAFDAGRAKARATA